MQRRSLSPRAFEIQQLRDVVDILAGSSVAPRTGGAALFLAAEDDKEGPARPREEALLKEGGAIPQNVDLLSKDFHHPKRKLTSLQGPASAPVIVFVQNKDTPTHARTSFIFQ